MHAAPIRAREDADDGARVLAALAAAGLLVPERPTLVPELELLLAPALVPVWEAAEAAAGARLEAPFWAFAWAGGQALARVVLDDPALVRGARVLDFAAGGGVAGLAAARAGAAAVVACDLDALARAMALENARRNGLALEVTGEDLVGRPLGPPGAPGGFDVVLAADACYERGPAARIGAWLRAEAAAGRRVLLGDGGRAFAPAGDDLVPLAALEVPVALDLEGVARRTARVWRLAGAPGPRP